MSGEIIPDVTFSDNNVSACKCAYDTVNEKFVILYREHNDDGGGTFVVVCSISGDGTIIFGIPVSVGVPVTSGADNIVFNETTGKFLILTDYSYNYIGTVIGDTITLGDAFLISTNYETRIVSMGDNRVAICNDDNITIGEIIGDTAVWGSYAVYDGGNHAGHDLVYDSVNDVIVLIYNKSSDSKAIICTITGTTISLGTPITLHTDVFRSDHAVFDPSSGKIVVVGMGSGFDGVVTSMYTVNGINVTATTPQDCGGPFPSYDSGYPFVTYNPDTKICPAVFSQWYNNSWFNRANINASENTISPPSLLREGINYVSTDNLTMCHDVVNGYTIVVFSFVFGAGSSHGVLLFKDFYLFWKNNTGQVEG